MRNKILLLSVLAIVLIFAVDACATSQNNDAVTGSQTPQVPKQMQTANQGEDNQIQTQNNEQVQSGSGTGNQIQNQEQNTLTVGQQNQEKNQEQLGQINAEQHRSTVANFVQSLLEVADRDEGIGRQVRVIVQQQNESASATVQSMEQVQTRSRIKTFLFGSDYRNLGTLRSEMVQTENRLEQLNRLMENVQNEEDETELQNQIQILEQEQTKIESFIKTQEGKFSLFGWLVKLFN